MLAVETVHTYYGESHVLHGVSLAVRAGEAVALLGRNGVGKTTLIRSIIGFTPPREGAVRLDGAPIHRLAAFRIAKRGIGLVPQGRRIFGPLSVVENLLLGARPGAGAWTPERVYELFPRLYERRLQGGGTLSGGEQQMLAVARALMTNPRLLLLDEPSEGLAPLIVREMGRVLVRLKREGLSILLVEQNVPLALRVADRVYVMSKGQIVYEGTPAGLDADEDVKRRFLGVA
ncbi:MAG: ABC transporter ATP-binding protein [Candidatus Rokubacteria bacterium RIFCSPLOWO2_02_FULL_73_56]|nr:MAG: ABC transporter ATP-binding protein [Candidatus Rokubacteria bacterium RIFCSPHIGHO2_02_FULL_73_26]OGL12666.1 MAG: ABC transporter ATP-binding protein [Candidatus Rokubacteria bacterium RIFCSPLOWO2_02_FULL_73_56]OGL29256.1 MAG: ABC transporter ATP-binding protein [Candidatus Rokubacteria bacterium RIFCSPLOWO2_12_FULL_73_47]